MKISDSGNEFSSAKRDTAGKYFFVNQPAANGGNNAAEGRNTICSTRISKCDPRTAKTMEGKTNGTATDVTIIMPTTSDNRPPIRFAPNRPPRAVNTQD